MMAMGDGHSEPRHTEAADARAIEPADVGLGRLFYAIRDAVVVGDPETGRIVLWNDAAERMFGYTSDEAVGSLMEMLVPDSLKERHRVGLSSYADTGRGPLVDSGDVTELPAICKDGSEIVVELTLTPIEGVRVPGRFAMAVVRDITDKKLLSAEMRELAWTDPLTGLFNRRAFEMEANRQLDFLRRYGPGGALIMFDIDAFKAINDSLGHQAGDDVLRAIAAVMTERTRATDICGRFGGDEFVILFPGVGPIEAELLANGLLDSIRERPPSAGEGAVPTASIGVCLFTREDVESLENLLGEADAAMYEAKKAGGNRFVVTAERRPPVVNGKRLG